MATSTPHMQCSALTPGRRCAAALPVRAHRSMSHCWVPPPVRDTAPCSPHLWSHGHLVRVQQLLSLLERQLQGGLRHVKVAGCAQEREVVVPRVRRHDDVTRAAEVQVTRAAAGPTLSHGGRQRAEWHSDKHHGAEGVTEHPWGRTFQHTLGSLATGALCCHRRWLDRRQGAAACCAAASPWSWLHRAPLEAQATSAA
jgi:hypothetical protein